MTDNAPDFEPVPPPIQPPTPPVPVSRLEPVLELPPRRASQPPPESAAPRARFTGVMLLLAGLLILQYVVPYVVEKCQYALTRGRQLAEYDAAKEGLKDLSLVSLSKAYQLVSQRVGPSVVHINVLGNADRRLPNDFSQLFGPQQRATVGQGSGVIMDQDGFIVTNFHVVHNASAIQVSLSDGRVLPASLVGVDELTDLAVLRIDAGQLTAAEWGDSEDLEVGALVWAAGSPFGLQSTITSGILSAKHRSGMAGEVYQDFLQTDAAVNPGNSGGPLVDVNGRVVGINTAILGEAYQGISFAIPSSVAQEVYQRLKTTGQMARGWLGVQLREVNEQDVRRLGLPDTKGALIGTVIDTPGVPSPAMEAGLQAGDVIVSWNGKPINKPAEFIRAVAMTNIGSTATLVIRRDGRERSVTVRIAERPVFRSS